jgi:endonuclease YncB( thermonuclease family)
MKWDVSQYIVVGLFSLGLGSAFSVLERVQVANALESEVLVTSVQDAGAQKPIALQPMVSMPVFGDVKTDVRKDVHGAVTSKPVRVIDGDTLAIGEARIRLHGIDAPELAQTCTDSSGRAWTCGAWSKAVLKRLTSGAVNCVEKDVDRYGRSVAACFVDGVDINAAMVAQGAAYAYVKYSSDYLRDQNAARAKSVGMWRAGAQMPSEYRADKRNTQAQAIALASKSAPSGCEIKGNISKSGQLYHVPGSRWYDRTSVNQSDGERWFCSEREAQAAGWRAAQG